MLCENVFDKSQFATKEMSTPMAESKHHTLFLVQMEPATVAGCSRLDTHFVLEDLGVYVPSLEPTGLWWFECEYLL